MYECHITIEKPTTRERLAQCESVGERHGWKTSFIDGDPVLGKKVYFYFTRHARTYGELYSRMKELEATLESNTVAAVRSKIEHIVYDTKTGVTP
jgi:hypothetical protein